MKKKLIAALAFVVIIVAALWGYDQLKPKPVAGAKTIMITIVNKMEDKTVLEKTWNTDAETLGQLLDEVSELKAETSDTSYGRMLISLAGIEQGDVATGPWWLYSSENNEVCLQAGMCPGIDDIVIKDQDNFTFMYTNSFE